MTRAAPLMGVQGQPFPASRWLSILLGGCLIAIPFLFGEVATARANSAVVGACVIAVAFYAIFVPSVRWLNTLLGVWMLVSTPLIVEHISRTAPWLEMAAGAGIVLASLASGRSGRPHRGAWPT
jgi:hypothetical protein